MEHEITLTEEIGVESNLGDKKEDFKFENQLTGLMVTNMLIPEVLSKISENLEEGNLVKVALHLGKLEESIRGAQKQLLNDKVFRDWWKEKVDELDG